MRLSDMVRSGPRSARPRETDGPVRASGETAREEAEPGRSPWAGDAPGAEARRDAPDPAPADGRTITPAPRLDATEVIFKKAVERIRQSLAARTEAPFSIAQAQDVVDMLTQSLDTSDALLVPFFGADDLSGNPARRAVNVCIVGLKMGLELGYARDELRTLGLAALLCDVGTSLVPAEVLDQGGSLSAKDRALLREQQVEGAKQLDRLAPEFRWLGDVIRKRYENPDGPHQPTDRFEEYVAIIHLAEVYKSLVHPRPPRKRIGPLDALKEILQRHRAVFPDRILKALIRAMSTFPVGSLVRLNTGDIGRVARRNTDFPLRPIVEILVRRGRRLEQPVTVDLSQSPLLHIKESVVVVEEGL